jgi:hypothetical protein
MTNANGIRNTLTAACLLAAAGAWRVVAATGAVPDTAPMCPAVPAGDHETYRLAPVKHPAAGLSSQIDWAQIPATGGWYGAQVMDSCRIHADGFLTWHGKAAARIEVQPSDDPLDLGVGSERAEMAFMQDSTGTQISENPASGTVCYATSYFFPLSWDGTFLKGDANSWSFVWQFYEWEALAAGRGYDADPTAQKYWFGANGSGNLIFTDGGNIAKGEWTDFVFMVNWANGHLDVWRRDQGQTAFTPVFDGSGAPATNTYYVKQGLYRGGDVNGRTDVLWVGPTARGSSFAAVEQAAFGTNNGNAVKVPFTAKPGLEGFNLNVSTNQGRVVFHITSKDILHIGIFSAGGKLVRTLNTMGATNVVWDGTNDRLEQVGPGVYFCTAMEAQCGGLVRIVKQGRGTR